ncbi:MAG: serine/threonine protein kinase [Gammaproteobacteria bacterium]|nr:serine/threonine protein kinase [Gammaproteobacteria bacterium]
MDKTLLYHPPNIARYRIDGVLGSGAMGVVYQGFDSQIERTVAIKVLHPHLREGEHGPDLEQRFLQEARAAARCLHPNIVTIFDFGSENGSPYIVMEFVRGMELKAHLKSDTFIPLPSATDICIQILEALGHAHEKGVIHRDIKPANIILLENGTVKVSDFGVARLDTSDLTSTGYMVGTPNYMSPEGLQGHTVDARSDLYSVGVLYFELLTRRRPSRDMALDEALEVLNDATQLSGQNIRSIKPILRQALQSNPTNRFQNSRDFITRLKAIDDMDLTQATGALFPTPAGYTQNRTTRPDTSSASPNSSSASQWNDSVLESLEHSLAKYIGPMARLLVRKQSRSATSMEDLVNSLTRHIPNENERTQFMRSVEKSGLSSPGMSVAQPAQTSVPAAKPGASTQAPVFTLTDAVRDKLSQLLAYHLGPLASRLVQKAMKSTLEPNALIAQLAQQIPDEKERKKFVEQAGKLF